jgi:hypothetical protein
MVLNHLPRNPWHLRRLPGKHIDISLNEDDERELLFVTQVPRDAGGLGSIRANLDDLHGHVLVI